MAIPRMWVLRDFQAESGHHPGDLAIEFFTATLAAGTIEVPTKFSNGKIVGVFAFRNSATVNDAQAFSSDNVVTTGAVTLSGPTGSTAVVYGCIIGRLDV